MNLDTRLKRLEAALAPPVRSVRDLSDEELKAQFAFLKKIREATEAGQATEELGREFEEAFDPFVVPEDELVRIQAMTEEECKAELRSLEEACKQLATPIGSTSAVIDN